MCYIVECIMEAFFPYYVPDRFLCGFDFNALSQTLWQGWWHATNWQTSEVSCLFVFFVLFVFIVFCTNYLKQKPSTINFETNFGDDVTHAFGATVGFAGHKAQNSLIKQIRAGTEAPT